MNVKDAFLPRTPLDYLIEAVEAEFGSIQKAPDYAMKPVWAYVKRHHMGVYNHKIQHNNSVKMKKYRHKKDVRSRKTFHTRVWQSGKTRHWLTNNKRVAYAAKVLYHNPKMSVYKACHIAHCDTKFISNYPISHHYFVYTCGPKKIKAYSLSMLIGKCGKDKFPFAPMKLQDIENHKYMGTINEYHYYDPLYYKKVT